MNLRTGIVYTMPKPLLVVRLLAVLWLVQVILSRKLWMTTEREFPLQPWFESLPVKWGAAGDFALFALLLLSLVATLFVPVKWLRVSIPAVVGVSLLLMLADVMRVQVWVVQYMSFILMALWYCVQPKHTDTVVKMMQYMVVFTYFWSGFHKLTPHFHTYVYNWLMGIYAFTRPLKAIHWTSYLPGVIELLMGVLLLIPRWRKGMVIFVTVFHALILALLIGDGWNFVVYPWNIAMVAFVWVLFWKQAEPRRWFLPFPLRSVPAIAFGIFWGLMPALYCFDLWDTAFSLAMYTGTSVEAHWYWEADDDPCLPEEVTGEIRVNKNDDNEHWIYLDDWSSKILQVPAYANESVYMRQIRPFCDCVANKDSAGLEIVRFPRYGHIVKKRLPCSWFQHK